MMPPRGEAKACTSALLSVRKPSCLGVASKEAATQMYTAARGTAMCLNCSLGDIMACIRCCQLPGSLRTWCSVLEFIPIAQPCVAYSKSTRIQTAETSTEDCTVCSNMCMAWRKPSMFEFSKPPRCTVR